MFIRLGISSRQSRYVNRFILNLVMPASEEGKTTSATTLTALVSKTLSYLKDPKVQNLHALSTIFLLMFKNTNFFYFSYI